MVACHTVIWSMKILYELKTPHVKYWKLKTCQLVKLSICFSFKSVHYMFFLLNNFVLRVCLFLPKKKKKRSSTNNFFPAHIFFVLIISIFASGFFKKWRVQRPIYIYIQNKKSSTNNFFSAYIFFVLITSLSLIGFFSHHDHIACVKLIFHSNKL